MEACAKLRDELEQAGVRVKLDDSENSPGWKFNEWEMKGVPVRIELGPRDLEAGKILCARRDTLEKSEMALSGAADGIRALLQTVQKNMLEAARKRRDGRIVYAEGHGRNSCGRGKRKLRQGGLVRRRGCEDKIKEKTAASARVYAEGETAETCAVCGKKAKHMIIYARAY